MYEKNALTFKLGNDAFQHQQGWKSTSTAHSLGPPLKESSHSGGRAKSTEVSVVTRAKK